MAANDITPVYIDLDTDGGVSGNHQLFEIAAVAGNVGNMKKFNIKIIGCQKLRKHRGTPLTDLFSLKDALIKFRNWLATLNNKKVFVAHNARNFDAIVLIQSFDKCNIRIPLCMEFVDSIDLILLLKDQGLCKFKALSS